MHSLQRKWHISVRIRAQHHSNNQSMKVGPFHPMRRVTIIIIVVSIRTCVSLMRPVMDLLWWVSCLSYQPPQTCFLGNSTNRSHVSALDFGGNLELYFRIISRAGSFLVSSDRVVSRARLAQPFDLVHACLPEWLSGPLEASVLGCTTYPQARINVTRFARIY